MIPEEKFKNKLDLSEVEDLKLQNETEVLEPLIISYKISQSTELLGDRLYVGLPLLPKNLKENPFKSEERKFPVDYGHPSRLVYRFTLTIPEGFKVESFPESLNLNLEGDKTTTFKFQDAGDNGFTLQILSVFQTGRGVYQPAEYQHLKNLYTNAIAKLSEQIVLKKKHQ